MNGYVSPLLQLMDVASQKYFSHKKLCVIIIMMQLLRHYQSPMAIPWGDDFSEFAAHYLPEDPINDRLTLV